MASTRLQEIRVGVVTILAVVVLVGGIIWGKGGGIGVDNRVITMIFPNAAGIELGAPITFLGVRKGSVTHLDARPGGVRITALLETSVHLKRDARAQIQMLEVTGGKKIEIVPGTAAEPLPPDVLIPGEVQGDITAMLADVGEITASAKIVVRRVDSTLVMVNGLIGSREFNDRLHNTLSNLEATSAAAREMIAGNRGKIDNVINTFDQLSGELRDLVQRSRPTVDRALASVDTISTDARRMLQHLDIALQHADTLLGRINGIADQVNHGDGAVRKLLTDKDFADELERTVKSIRILMEGINQGKTKIPLKIGF